MIRKLKVAIVGCGKIADSHAFQIQGIEGCEIVGAFDREPLMAQQLHERFPIEAFFSDVDLMLNEARPDVVHISTPPESHFEVARLCLERGCHIYVEKPFTVNAAQAQYLLDLAEDRGLKLTVGHNYQFTHAARRMRAAVECGYLGGAPVHMESTYCYNLADRTYAKALLGDKNHWVRRLPGKLLHNIISHGIASIAEFLPSDSPEVISFGFVSPIFKEINETDTIDELRAIISDGERTTAYFTFSTRMKPALHEFRLYGPKNGLILDQNHEILIKLRGANYKSYAEKFIPPVSFAKQHIKNLTANLKLFLNRDFHMDAGMKYLIEAFYCSIREDAPVPIPYSQILLTARIMDTIFDQLANRQTRYNMALQNSPKSAAEVEQ